MRHPEPLLSVDQWARRLAQFPLTLDQVAGAPRFIVVTQPHPKPRISPLSKRSSGQFKSGAFNSAHHFLKYEIVRKKWLEFGSVPGKENFLT